MKWLFLSPSNTPSAHNVLPQVSSFRNVVCTYCGVSVVSVLKTVDKARLLSSDVLQVAALSNSLVPLKLNHLKPICYVTLMTRYSGYWRYYSCLPFLAWLAVTILTRTWGLNTDLKRMHIVSYLIGRNTHIPRRRWMSANTGEVTKPRCMWRKHCVEVQGTKFNISHNPLHNFWRRVQIPKFWPHFLRSYTTLSHLQ